MNSIDNWKDAARRWLRALRAGDPQAQARLRVAHPHAPAEPSLRDVQHALAREQGHANWIALRGSLQPAALDSGDPMQPVELRREFPMALHGGLLSTTTEVWHMLSATRAGELDTVRAIVEANPAMVDCEHNYMPPLQLAVREQHTDIVAYLLEHGAYDPKFETYPYRESIHEVAEDRGSPEIAALLEKHRVTERPRVPSAREAGSIDFSGDPQHVHRSNVEKLINQDAIDAVKAMLAEHPDLLHDSLLFWGEGILAAPTSTR